MTGTGLNHGHHTEGIIFTQTLGQSVMGEFANHDQHDMSEYINAHKIISDM